MRTINLIVIHCSATDDDVDIGVAEIRKWHLDKGWSDIGYHWVIRRDGTVEKGRPEDVAGAHAEGHNAHSIGVCMVGGVEADDKMKAECNFTRAQWAALPTVVHQLLARYPESVVLGHRDLPGVTKACPCFDARAWWYGKKANAPALIA